MSRSCVQCDTGCGFLAGTAVSHLTDLPSVPAQEIPAQSFPPLPVSDSRSEWALHLSPSAEFIPGASHPDLDVQGTRGRCLKGFSFWV